MSGTAVAKSDALASSRPDRRARHERVVSTLGALAGLAATAFVSATFLPGGTEAVLAALMLAGTAPTWLLVAVASGFNTLGAVATYALGRLARRWGEGRAGPGKESDEARATGRARERDAARGGGGARGNGAARRLLARVAPTDAEGSRARGWFARWGPATLLMSWLPLVGDAIPFAAGLLRVSPWLAVPLIGVGKTARFVVVAWGVGAGAAALR